MCLIFHVMLLLGFYFKCNFHLHLQEWSAVSKLKDEKTSVTKQNEKLRGELVLFDFYALYISIGVYFHLMSLFLTALS